MKNHLLTLFLILFFNHIGFSIVNSDGSYSHNIGLELPAGIIGTTPDLSLEYNSGSVSDGILGVGWSLSGIAAITRTDFGKGINYNQNDTFTGPDGRLMKQPEDGQNGWYAEKDNLDRYLPNPEGCPNPGGYCSWKVHTSDGKTLYFGSSENSRSRSTRNSAIRSWMLDRVENESGHYLTIEYNNDREKGAIYPAVIRYSLKNGGAQGFERSIHLEYEKRKRVYYNTSQNSLVTINKRLKSIETRIQNRPIKRYELGYDVSPTTGRDRLRSVILKNGDQTEPVWQKSFDYSAPKGGIVRYRDNNPVPINTGWAKSTKRIQAAWKMTAALTERGELRAYSDYNPNGPEAFLIANDVVDFQYLADRRHFGIEKGFAWLTEKGEFQDSLYNRKTATTPWNTDNGYVKRFIVSGGLYDYNRIPGWVAVLTYGNTLWIKTTETDSWKQYASNVTEINGREKGLLYTNDAGVLKLLDFGDHNGAAPVEKKVMDETSLFTSWAEYDFGKRLAQCLHFLREDRKTVHLSDPLTIDRIANAYYLGVAPKNRELEGSCEHDTKQYHANGVTLDYTGKLTYRTVGRHHGYKYCPGTTLEVCANIGTGMGEPIQKKEVIDFALTPLETHTIDRTRTVDGWKDVIQQATSHSYEYYSKTNDDRSPDTGYENRDVRALLQQHQVGDLLTTIRNGFGAVTTIDYKLNHQFPTAVLPSANNCGGSQCGKAASDPVSLVHRVTVNPGRGSILQKTTYDYHNGRIAPKRSWNYDWNSDRMAVTGPTRSHRFLGFEWITQTNENTGEIKKSYYSQKVPFENSPIRVENYSGEGKLTSRTSMEWQFHTTREKSATESTTSHDWLSTPYRTLLKNRTVENFEAGVPISTVTTDYQYDTFGFETAKTTCHAAGSKEENSTKSLCKTTETTYRNHETLYNRSNEGWIFGQVTKQLTFDTTETGIKNLLSGKRWEWSGTGTRTDKVQATFQLYCRNANSCDEATGNWIPVEQNLRYDDAGRLIASTNAKGVTTELEYDPDLHLLAKQTVYGEGKAFTTKKQYYKTGPSIGLLQSESSLYNGFGNPTESQIGKTVYEWDTQRRLKREINPMGGETLHRYGINGKVTPLPASNATAVINAALTGVELPADVTNDSQYKMVIVNEPYPNNDGTVSHKVHTAIEYSDGLGKLYRTETIGKDEEGNDQTVITTHDETFEGTTRVRTSTWPHLQNESPKKVVSRYDSQGRKVRITRPNTTDDQGFQTFINYNHEMVGTKPTRTIAYTDPLSNQPTVEFYDDRGLLVQKRDALGNRTTYEYDSEGRAIKVSLPMAETAKGVTTITWDSLGRKTSMWEYATGLTCYQYDDVGNLTTVTDSRARIDRTYDDLNRVISKQVTLLSDAATNGTVTDCANFSTTGTVESSITYRYDEGPIENFGNLTSVDLGETEMFYDYDRAGNMIARKWYLKGMDSIGSTFDFEEKAQYNAFGRMLRYHFPDGKTEQDMTWTAKGELQQVGIREQGVADGNRQLYTTFSDYTPTGRFQRKAYLNGVVTNYDYYEPGLLRSMKTCKPGQPEADCTTGTIQDLEYIFHAHPGYISEIRDHRNNRVMQDIDVNRQPIFKQGATGTKIPQMANTGESQRFQYDPLGRLKQVSWDGGQRQDRYDYDSIGNMTGKQSFQTVEINDLIGSRFSTVKNRRVDPATFPTESELFQAGLNVTWNRTVTYPVPLNCESSFTLGCQSHHKSGALQGIETQQRDLHKQWQQRQGSLYDCELATSEQQFQSCRSHRDSAFAAWLQQVDHQASCNRQELLQADPVLPNVFVPLPNPNPNPYPGGNPFPGGDPGPFPGPFPGGDPAPWVLSGSELAFTVEDSTTEASVNFEPLPPFSVSIVDSGYCKQSMDRIHQQWLTE